MCCTWFAHGCARATSVYVLDTVRGAVRRLLKTLNSAFECDYYYYYYYFEKYRRTFVLPADFLTNTGKYGRVGRLDHIIHHIPPRSAPARVYHSPWAWSFCWWPDPLYPQTLPPRDQIVSSCWSASWQIPPSLEQTGCMLYFITCCVCFSPSLFDDACLPVYLYLSASWLQAHIRHVNWVNQKKRKIIAWCTCQTPPPPPIP